MFIETRERDKAHLVGVEPRAKRIIEVVSLCVNLSTCQFAVTFDNGGWM